MNVGRGMLSWGTSAPPCIPWPSCLDRIPVRTLGPGPIGCLEWPLLSPINHLKLLAWAIHTGQSRHWRGCPIWPKCILRVKVTDTVIYLMVCSWAEKEVTEQIQSSWSQSRCWVYRCIPKKLLWLRVRRLSQRSQLPILAHPYSYGALSGLRGEEKWE